MEVFNLEPKSERTHFDVKNVKLVPANKMTLNEIYEI